MEAANNPGRKKTLFDAYVSIIRSPQGIQQLQDLWSEKLLVNNSSQNFNMPKCGTANSKFKLFLLHNCICVYWGIIPELL